MGELEDAYAERLQPGDRFLLDGRCLEYRRDEQRTLPGRGGRRLAASSAGWDSEGWLLSAELARRLYGLRVRAAEALRSGNRMPWPISCGRNTELDDMAALALLAFFQRAGLCQRGSRCRDLSDRDGFASGRLSITMCTRP